MVNFVYGRLQKSWREFITGKQKKAARRPLGSKSEFLSTILLATKKSSRNPPLLLR